VILFSRGLRRSVESVAEDMFAQSSDLRAGMVKSQEEIRQMRKAGGELALIRDALGQLVKPGVTTAELDEAAQEMIEAIGAKPAFLGYRGFSRSICTSVNEEVVHGIPSPDRTLKQGDVISIDVGLLHYGFVSDTAITVPVGEIDPEVSRLLAVTRRSLEIGIEAARPGQRLGDLGSAIQEYVEAEGFSVVTEYTGHGIGRQMHEEPKVPNFGKPGKGMRLRDGMVIALEPMVNMGQSATRELGDGWTVVTADGKPSAHFEHTIALSENGAEILTA